MAWIRVTETFRYRPNQGTCIVYRPGTYNVPTAAATLAVAAGKAVRMTKARKDEEPTYVHVDTREHVEDGWRKVERVGDPVFLKDEEPVEWRSEPEQATSTIE